MAKSSRISEFYKKSVEEKVGEVADFASLDEKDLETLKEGGISREQAERMIENVIGTTRFPFAVAVNFLINDKDYLIPMVIEEPSVVAAASNAAKIMREGGGLKTNSDDPIMIGQVQLTSVKNPKIAERKILDNKKKILEIANGQDPTLVKFGGGARDIEARVIGDMVVVHLLVDVRDAMGANAVNTMCEAVAPFLEELSNGKVILRIISNFAVKRLVRAEIIIPKEALGDDTIEKIILAYKLAEKDVYRAVTHNKGIMNGIIAIALATCNDTRALEAGAHAYASISGTYKPLSVWEKDKKGNLRGSIELPLAVGIVGGATRTHPMAQLSLKILGVKTARELAEVMAAVGLTQNFAALRALATEGIQRGHMELHARNIAIMAGVKGKRIDAIAERMIKEKNIRVDRAKELLDEKI